MNHSGKPLKAALRIIFWTLVLLLALFAAGVLATLLGSVVAMISSVLVSRTALRIPGQMPPLGTIRADPEGTKVLVQWINSLKQEARQEQSPK